MVWTPALRHPCASRLPSDLCRLGALSLHGPVSRQKWSQAEGLRFVGTQGVGREEAVTSPGPLVLLSLPQPCLSIFGRIERMEVDLPVPR